LSLAAVRELQIAAGAAVVHPSVRVGLPLRKGTAIGTTLSTGDEQIYKEDDKRK